MILAERVRILRLEAKLSQGDIERTTGLRRQYLSRVENGRTMPSIETLEKLAMAMRVPLYQFFRNGSGKAAKLAPPSAQVAPNPEHRTILKLLKLVSRIGESDRALLMAAAKKMAQLQRMGLRGAEARP